MSARLALIGAPGAGKSAVAEELGRRWDCPVRDSDADYERHFGETVAEAVIADEPGFRVREREVTLAGLERPGAVVAVGSGALSADVRESLADVPVVWLDVGLAEAARRTGLSGMRPVALGNVRGQLHQMLQERALLYAELADLTVSTDSQNVSEVADLIEEWESTR